MDFRSLVIPIRMKEGFTMVFADSFPVRAPFHRIEIHLLCSVAVRTSMC